VSFFDDYLTRTQPGEQVEAGPGATPGTGTRWTAGEIAAGQPDLTRTTEELLFQTEALHGTAYDFQQFSLEKAGQGEGETAFGFGVYLTSWKAALDTEYRLDIDESRTIRMECTKSKDSIPLAPCAFQLKQVPIGLVDEDGRDIFSAVLVPAEYEARSTLARLMRDFHAAPLADVQRFWALVYGVRAMAELFAVEAQLELVGRLDAIDRRLDELKGAGK